MAFQLRLTQRTHQNPHRLAPYLGQPRGFLGGLTRFFEHLGSHLGIDAGLVRGRTISREDTLRNARRDLNFYDPENDSLLVIQQSFMRTAETTTEYLGLYASLTYPLVEDDLYFIAHGEVRQRDIRRDITFAVDSTRTLAFADTVLSAPFVPFGTLVPGLEDHETMNRFRTSDTSGYFGAGLLLDVRDRGEGVRYRLKGVLGIRDDRRAFYLVKFQLVERELGLRLGGELQGLLARESIRVGTRRVIDSPGFPPPIISVYLAKVFSLQRLGQFIGS